MDNESRAARCRRPVPGRWTSWQGLRMDQGDNRVRAAGEGGEQLALTLDQVGLCLARARGRLLVRVRVVSGVAGVRRRRRPAHDDEVRAGQGVGQLLRGDLGVDPVPVV